MRRLVWLAVGLAGGCALGAYVFANPILLPVAAVGILASILLFLLKRAKPALICLGLTLGILYTAGYSQFYFHSAKPYDETQIAITITATDYSTPTSRGISCQGEFSLSGRKYDVLFYLNEEITLQPGDRVEGEFLLRLTSPGGSQESSYYQGNGIYFIASSQGEVRITPGNGQDIRYFPQRLRKTVLEKLETVFPAYTAGFAKALLLGDTSGLTYGQEVAFQNSGIRHIVAVSGLHVSILFSLVYLLSGKKTYLTAIFGIPTLVLFAFVAGLSPSIVRACIMQCIMILALLFRREYDPPSALATAVMVILLSNPFSVVSVSFQLSCGCMVGIFLFTTRLQKYIYSKIKGFSLKAKALRAIGASLSVTVGTMIPTVPLCTIYFGSISLVGVLTNVLTLWAVSIIFYGIVTVGTLSFLWLPLAKLLATIISVLMHYVLLVAKLLGSIPFAAVYTASPYIVLWIVLCYGLFAFFWLRGRKHLFSTAAAMAVLLVIATAFSWIEPRLDDYRVTVMDVGQGQCVLLQSKGESYLVDCGGDGDQATANKAAAQLLSQGVNHIDGLILTHYDKDHIGGISYFLQRISVDIVYLPNTDEMPDGLPTGQKTQILSTIRKIPVGTGKLTLIPGKNQASGNENSTCVLFQAAECAILITGDRAAAGEQTLMQQMDLPKVDYLIAGHHGASDSTGTALLEKTAPETVIISVGIQNRYGHPHSETLERIRTFGSNILRTDLHGTIIIRG